MLERVKYIWNLICLLFFSFVWGQEDSILVKQLLDKAYDLEQIDKDSSLYLYKLAADKGLKSGYYIGAGRAVNYSGIVHADYGNNDSAIYYYKKSIPIYEKAKYYRGVASAYINIGNAYQFSGDYQPAVDNYLKGIEIYQDAKDTTNLVISFQNLAALFTDFRMYSKSLEYQRLALNYSKQINDTISQAYLYTDIGVNQLQSGLTEEAYETFKNAYRLSTLLNIPDLNYYTNRNFYEYYLGQGELDSARHYLRLTNENARLTKKPYQQAYALDALANIFLKNNEIDSSRYYVEASIAMAKEIGAKELLMNSYGTLSQVEAKSGNYKAAHSALQLNINYQDSVLGQEQQEYITRLENLYQLNVKDNEILRQQLALENSETLLQKSRAQNLLYGLIAILVAGIAFIFWYRARQRKKLSEQTIETLKREQELQAVASLIKGEDQERERIARDLHDSVNGSLAALKLQLESVPIDSLNQFDAKKLDTSMQLIDNTCERIRNISHNLAPPALIHSGLVEALESYCGKINGTNNIDVTFQHHGEMPSLDKKSETTLYHIAQELLQNSIKHSGAKEILVQTYGEESHFHLTVEDNGYGYDQEKVKMGMGLNNIASRTKFLGADIQVRSDKDGTTTTIIVDGNKIPRL